MEDHRPKLTPPGHRRHRCDSPRQQQVPLLVLVAPTSRLACRARQRHRRHYRHRNRRPIAAAGDKDRENGTDPKRPASSTAVDSLLASPPTRDKQTPVADSYTHRTITSDQPVAVGEHLVHVATEVEKMICSSVDIVCCSAAASTMTVMTTTTTTMSSAGGTATTTTTVTAGEAPTRTRSHHSRHHSPRTRRARPTTPSTPPSHVHPPPPPPPPPSCTSSNDELSTTTTRSTATTIASFTTNPSTSSSDDLPPTMPPPLEPTQPAVDELCQRLEFKLRNSAEEVLSYRSSFGSAVDEPTATCDRGLSRCSSTSSAGIGSDCSGRRSHSRLENKLKLLARYIKTMSMGLGHKQRRIKNQQGGNVLVMRKSQVSLSQYMQPRSAPDVLGSRTQLPLHGTYGGPTSTPNPPRSSTSQKSAMSWDEICAGAILVEENEIMPASPRSRKRGRPIEMFEDAQVRRLCSLSGVPAANVNEVVELVCESFGTALFDTTVLHELVAGNSVVLVGMLVFSNVDCGEEYLDLHRLPSFLGHIQRRYNEENPFHNACHAADVLHTLFLFLWTTDLGERIAVHNQIAALFAALMHDIEHVGLTNDFLLKTNHEIAMKYATRAPLEEMHTALAIEVLEEPTYDVLEKLSTEQRTEALSIVCSTIRSTALIYQKELLRDVYDVTDEMWRGGEGGKGIGLLPLRLQTIALRCAMHVSDISQTMKPFAIHAKWVHRLNEEGFRQGELDRRLGLDVSPRSCYRDEWTEAEFIRSQVGFLEHLALPAVQALNSIPWLDAESFVQELERNIQTWQAQRAPPTAA